MKLEDIVLVKEHIQGRTLKYLSTLDDFMLVHVRLKTDSLVMSGELALELFKTLSDDCKWMQMQLSENKKVEARLCIDESQLRGFLSGRYDDDQVRTIFEQSKIGRAHV